MRFDAAGCAKQMLRDVRIETVGGQRIGAAEQREALRRNDQMQVRRHAADRTVAFRRRDARRRSYFEAHASAVTTAAMDNHECLQFTMGLHECIMDYSGT
jgi:hypothetical protein